MYTEGVRRALFAGTNIPDIEVMPVSCPKYFLSILVPFCSLLTIALFARAEGSVVALPLLEAPINATWAANHAEEWHEKGFRGFLLEGILDDLQPFPSEREALERASA